MRVGEDPFRGLVGAGLLRRDDAVDVATQLRHIAGDDGIVGVGMADEAELVLSAPRRTQVIRLGIPEDFDVSRLAALLAGFAASHPDIRLETGSGMSADLKAGLAAGELDLALIKREPNDGPCLAAWLERLLWVGNPRLLQRAEPVPLVLFPQGCIYRKRMIYALESAGRPWRAAYHSQSLAGVQAAVTAGLGISLLPAFACLPQHAILGASQGLAPPPPTELAIVGEARAAERGAVANLVAVLKRAVGEDSAASCPLASA